MTARKHYNGDINLEHGGYFYTLDNLKYDYADAWRVVPMSDAGGPDNQFWLEELTVNLPTEPARINNVLGVCGYECDCDNLPSKRAKQIMLLEACVAYGSYDQTSSVAIRIGKNESTARTCSVPDGSVV